MNTNTPQVNITIDQTEEVICAKCGNNTFVETTLLRKASRLLTGAPKDSYVPIPVFTCASCHNTNDEFIPAELKKSKVIKNLIS